MALTDVNVFFSNLFNIKDNLEFEKYCLNEKENIRNNYSTSTSVKTIFTKYKNKSKLFKFDKERQSILNNVFILEKQESEKIRLDYATTVSKNLNSLKWIYNVNDYINISIDLIKSSKITDNIIGLAALTGRRVAEIGCLASFKYKTIDYVLFNGQLKTRERYDVKPYLIPVLYNSKEIIEVLNKIRHTLSKCNDNTVLFHDTYSKTLSTTTKKSYSEVLQGIVVAKDLRAVYAIIANSRFNDGSVGITRYIASILGHSEIDNNTCNSYIKYRLQ